MNKSPAATTSRELRKHYCMPIYIILLTVYFCKKLIQAAVIVNAFTKISSGRKSFESISDEKMFN